MLTPGEQNLDAVEHPLRAELEGVPQVVRGVARLAGRGADLAGIGNMPVSGYSDGMRRRLDIATSLILDPPVLFLDELATGLDPRGRAEVFLGVRAWRSVLERW